MKPLNGAILMTVVALCLCGCASTPPDPFREEAYNRITKEINDRPRVHNPVGRALLFPVNLPADIASNFVLGLYPGQLGPIQYILLPFSALYWGIGDAVWGYPFWSPTAMYD